MKINDLYLIVCYNPNHALVSVGTKNESRTENFFFKHNFSRLLARFDIGGHRKIIFAKIFEGPIHFHKGIS